MLKLVLATSLMVNASVFSQTLQLRDDGASVTFVIENFGISVSGNLSGINGMVHLSEDDPGKSFFEATVKSETIDTGIPLRDKHLRQEKYFDVGRYPLIKLVSTRVSRSGNRWLAEAELTMKNVTKGININFTRSKLEGLATLTGSFKLNRVDFNVGGNSLTLSDTVEVRFEVRGSGSGQED